MQINEAAGIVIKSINTTLSLRLYIKRMLVLSSHELETKQGLLPAGESLRACAHAE